METKKNNENVNDAIASLVKSINEHPDMLHLDHTPAVQELIGHKLEGIKAVLPLLNSNDKLERYRAQRVVEGVIHRQFGWKSGQGYPQNSDGEQQYMKLWIANGNYTAEAPEEVRLKAIKLWENWLKENYTNGNE